MPPPVPRAPHGHPACAVAGCHELALALARRAGEQGSTLSFDPNLRPTLWPARAGMIRSLNALAALSDLVLPGLAEGRLLTGREQPHDIAAFYLDLGARAVVVKLGPDGAFCADRDGFRAHIPGVPVAHVVDTVGAGEGFAVGTVSGLLEGLPLGAAAQRGCAIGARVVQFTGDCDGLPTRAQLNR
jgi:sugar/nucleoside kinase (ribokinase family)